MQRREQAALVFAGEGELRGALESYVRDHHLDSVHFLGFINQRELPKIYAMSDVFVLPSIVEPRGAMINETMACGLPIIVTDHYGSIGDIVEPGENAFVIAPGDDARLAEHLSELTEHVALRMWMGGRSRELIAKCIEERPP